MNKSRPLPAARSVPSSLPSTSRRLVVPTALRRRARYVRSVSAVLAMMAAATTLPTRGAPADDIRAVAALDTAYQLAVKTNDAATVDRILADGMVLVTGRGKVFQRTEFIEQARNRVARYDKQDELPGTQQVRLFGEDTAVVTALLWIKGQHKGGNAFDYRVWFSDTYVRTPSGWRYAFGQSSLPLPKDDVVMTWR